jgi:hypothetical protein
MDSINILDWNSISNKYERSTILIGNGASIAVSSCFRYDSLLENARQNFIQDNTDKLFEYFETKDFELILRLVWQARKIVDITGEHHCIHYKKLEWIYEEIRDGLIKAVRQIHPLYASIDIDKLKRISNFLRRFDTVISLNYDLIVYWASLTNDDSNYSFKDCFIGREFREKWQELRKPIRNSKHCTLIFYPHGNLILYKDMLSCEFKLHSDENINLLDTILDKWENGSILPLFVSEGTEKQKVKSIRDSYYLSVVYREVLTEKRESLVVYGWGFGEQDMHILKQMKYCGVKNIAVSVYNNDKEYCNNVLKIIKKELGNSINVEFFHSGSKDCWIY